MKKFPKIFYLLMLAVLVLSLSGCGSSRSNVSDSSTSVTPAPEEQEEEIEDEDVDEETEEITTTTEASAKITTETRTGFDNKSVTVIELSMGSGSDSDTKRVKAADETLSVKNYVWNISADSGEYWTDPDGEIITDEDEVINALASDEGIYIARDIRYVPDTLEFSSTTVTKERNGNDQCYVSYYNQTADNDKKYILAALPNEYNGQQNVALETVQKAMTHSALDALKNPVLHITKAGIYALSGTWHGQIWVDIPNKTTNSDLKTADDPDAQVILILEGLEVSCDVAPALVFKNVFQCSGDIKTYDEVSALITGDNYSIGEKLAYSDNYSDNYYAGAVVLLANGTENTLVGTNVARLNELEFNDDDEDGYSKSEIGSYVKAQSKMYKFDAALHSRRSIVIGNEETSGSTEDGTLTVSSDYEGIGSELHMLIDSGIVNISANDDGINVNEDNVSVFTMTGGTLNITSNYGDGIDSNGWVALKDCTLNITAGSHAKNANGEAGIDAEKEVYGITVDSSGDNPTSTEGVNYTYTSNQSSTPGNNPGLGRSWNHGL